MLRNRRFLVPAAVAWLFLHVSVVTGTTALLLTTGTAAADIVCTCAHGADHGSCPMHKTSQGSARCRMQSTQNDLGHALFSMLGPLALPPGAATALTVVSAPVPKGYNSTLPSDWAVPPDAPPPRG